MDILLILGSVTVKQCEPPYQAMLDRDIKAEIRHVKAASNHGEFFQRAIAEWERNHRSANQTNVSVWEPWVESRVEELEAEAINSAMQGASLDDVKALLFQKDAVIDEDWLWVTAGIHTDTPCYRVEQSESDDSEFLIGRGYGEVLDIR